MGRSKAQVTSRTFRFLTELAENNDREWFAANKQRYLDELRDPLLDWIEAFAPKLRKLSAHMLADPRPVGGSLFRVYRDTRFSKDKRPYKTHAGLSFRHADGRDVHGPIFYLHLEPGRIFTAAGLWHPPSETLRQVRDAIVAHPERWKRATRGRGCAIDDGGESLKRAPRGYDPEHPLVEELKRKSFTASTEFMQKQACAVDFADRVASAYRSATPLMQFLTSAVGLRW
jgi:uncharacterized protein (TIGR02453 family)